MFKQVVYEPWEAMVSLVKGLKITLIQMFMRPCTIQYPEERLVWPDRTRGRLVLPRTEAGQNKCTSCMMCQKICPNGSIEIKSRTGEGNKRVLEDYIHYLGQCTFCGLCVEVCPFDALRMSHEHEIAVTDKALLVRHLQNESMLFDPAWKGGLPAKADKPAAAPQTEGSAPTA